jgi:hypothetical protein
VPPGVLKETRRDLGEVFLEAKQARIAVYETGPDWTERPTNHRPTDQTNDLCP